MKHEKHLTSPMYEMLGMLGEYLGRDTNCEYPGQLRPEVERFYPHEERLADCFEQLIKKHETTMRTPITWFRETEPTGHIYFYSLKLSYIVNSFYVGEVFHLTLARKILDKASVEDKLCYLAGAYRRFGKNPMNVIQMANAPFKMETIGSVLASLGCTNPQLNCEEGFPMDGLLIFQPCDSVRDRLGIQETIRDKNELWKKPT